MESIITLESELRVLEVDPKIIVEKITSLGGKKLFDGVLDTRLFISNALEGEPRKIRLRHYKGLYYIYINATGSAITKTVDYTERVVKTKLPRQEDNGNVPAPRRYSEKIECIYHGNSIDELSREYRALGIDEHTRDMRNRTSYILESLVRFDLDEFTVTRELGQRALPLMLEVETPDDSITRDAIQKLGFSFDEELSPGFKKVNNFTLRQIFDYYSRQS